MTDQQHRRMEWLRRALSPDYNGQPFENPVQRARMQAELKYLESLHREATARVKLPVAPKFGGT